LGELARATLNALRPRLDAAGIAAALEVSPGVVARADRDKLRQVLVNLLENARDALATSPSPRRVTVAVRNGEGVATLSVTDNSLPGVSGMDVLRWARERAPETAVVMITAFSSEKIAVEAMKLGAADYIPKPFDNDELELVVERLLEGMEVRRSLRLLQEQVAGAYRFGSLIGKSAGMQRVFDVIRKVADTDLTVLVRGPSGTGKELVANALHYNGPRR